MYPEGTAALAALGLTLGAAAGVSPGPHMAVLMQESLRHGPRSGVQVAIAPLLTDGPIVLVTLGILHLVATVEVVTMMVSLVGAAYLAWLGIESLRTQAEDLQPTHGETPDSLRRGMLVNLANPNAWVFWATIGSPILLMVPRIGAAGPVLFLVLFYILLVGIKAGFAVALGRGGRVLGANGLRWIHRALGVLLLLFAGSFVHAALGPMLID